MITEAEKIGYSELQKLIQCATINSEHTDELITFLRKVWDNEDWNSILHKFRSKRKPNWMWWKFGVRELIHMRRCV